MIKTDKPLVRRSVDIEKYIELVYREELPKLLTSSSAGIWWLIEEYGQRGGIDPGHGSAQRYAHHGVPHPDAEITAKLITSLPEVEIDWGSETEAIVGDYSALLTVHRMVRPIGPIAAFGGKMQSWSRSERQPKVLFVRSRLPAALIVRHASGGTQPDWWEDVPKPCHVPADRGPGIKIHGECRGRNVYTSGSYCPLQWEPSPMSILESRVDYLIWWRGLRALSAMINPLLSAHVTTGPEAPEMPWLEPQMPHTVLPFGKRDMSMLPLKPQRETAGRLKRRRLGSAVEAGR